MTNNNQDTGRIDLTPNWFEEQREWTERLNERMRTWQTRASAFVRIVSHNPPAQGIGQPVLYHLDTDTHQRVRVWDYLNENDQEQLDDHGWDKEALGQHLYTFWKRSRKAVDTPLHLQLQFISDHPPSLFVLHTVANGDERRAILEPDYLMHYPLDGVMVGIGGMYQGGLNVFDLLPESAQEQLWEMGLTPERFHAALRKLYVARRHRILSGCGPVNFILDRRLIDQLLKAARIVKKEARRRKAKAG